MALKRTRNQTNNSMIFLLSGIPNDKRQEYGKMIRELGGVYFDIECFRATCTHVIVGKLTRSEKFLGGCATGKWILKTDFIEESYEHKKWLQEELYEWTDQDTDKPELKEMANAPRRWRESFLLNDSSFSGIKAAILVDGNKRKTVYKRLLSSGGATIYNLQLPITKPDRISNVLQYIFADKALAKKHIPDTLLDYGILCLSPDYIGDFLVMATPPNPYEYLVAGPTSVLSALSKKCTVSMDDICFSQSSTCSIASVTPKKIPGTFSRCSPSSSSQTNIIQQITPVKPVRKSMRVAVKKINSPFKPKSNRTKLEPLSGQKQLNQFGFSSVKKVKREVIQEESGKDNVMVADTDFSKNIDPVVIRIKPKVNGFEENENNVIHSKIQKTFQTSFEDSNRNNVNNQHSVQKRLDFTNGFQTPVKSFASGRITSDDSMIIDLTPSLNTPMLYLNTSYSVKRKALNQHGDLQPVTKKAKFGPIKSTWNPSTVLLSYNSQADLQNIENESNIQEVSMSIVHIIETCIEDEYYIAALDLLSSSFSTKHYLPSSLLYKIMVNILLESPNLVTKKKCIEVLMNHLSLHPPHNQHLRTVYRDSFEIINDDITTDNKIFTFITIVIKSALLEITREDEELFNNRELLRYIMTVLQVDFKHFLNRLQHGESGKITHRSCLFIKFLWQPGYQIFSNKRTRELLEYYEECLMVPGDSVEKMKLLEVLTGFMSLIAQSLKLSECGWIVNNNPTIGDKSTSFIVDFSQKVLNCYIEESYILESVLQWLKPCWFCLGVTVQLLTIYDDYLLVEGIDITSISLSRIVTQYFFLLPKLRSQKQHELVMSVKKNKPALRTRNNNIPPIKQIIPTTTNNIVSVTPKLLIPDKQLLKKVNTKNMKGETPLHIACIKNDVRRVKQLLTVPGINVNAVDNYGWSPLHEACNHGHIECVELLLKYCPAKTVDSYFSPGGMKYRKVDLLASNVDGITPLHDAVMTGWTDICQLLLKYGGPAILEAKTKAGKKPIDFAGTEDIQKILYRQPEPGFSQSQDSLLSSQSSFDSRLDWLPTDCLYDEILADHSRIASKHDCMLFVTLITTLVNQYISSYNLCTLQETLKNCTVNSKSLECRKVLQGRQPNGSNNIDISKPRVDGKKVMKVLDINEDQLKRGYKDLKVLSKIKKYLTIFERHLKRITTEEDFVIVLPKVNFLKMSLSSIM